MPKVSVILLTYNQAETIGRALESVINQVCDFDFEIVVGEDCSSDSTRQLCQRYAERFPDKVRLMPQSPNKGIVDNYFDCLEACRGDYVTDCAGDDYWPDLTRLQKQADYLDKHPDVEAVISDWTIQSSSTTVCTSSLAEFNPLRNRISGRRLIEITLGSDGIMPLLSAVMFRRPPVIAFLNEHPDELRRNDWHCEDLPMFCALGSCGDMGYTPANSVHYFSDSETVSNSSNFGRQFDFYIGPACAVAHLANFYKVDPMLIGKKLDRRISYLVSCCWHSLTSERLNSLQSVVQNWPRPLPYAARLRLLLMPFRQKLRL